MKLTTVTHVSIDGVLQGLGGPSEDPRGGFERGGWAMPLFDDEGGALVGEIFRRADAFLFGRWTYELFTGYWGPITDPDNPIASALNKRPKYLASTTITDPQWADTTRPRRRPSDRCTCAQGECRWRAASARQWHAGSLASRPGPGRRAHPARLSRRHRPGQAAVSGVRPGPSSAAGRLASHPEGRASPGLPTRRTTAVRD